MKPNELRDLIDSLTMDIEFGYKGIDGSICPFSRANISVSYGEAEKTYNSIDGVMNSLLIEGKPLYEICENFTIY